MNMWLTSFLVVAVAMVLGLGVGHFLGWSERLELQVRERYYVNTKWWKQRSKIYIDMNSRSYQWTSQMSPLIFECTPTPFSSFSDFIDDHFFPLNPTSHWHRFLPGDLLRGARGQDGRAQGLAGRLHDGRGGKRGWAINESMRTQSFTNTFLDISSVPQEVEIRFLNGSTFSRWNNNPIY